MKLKPLMFDLTSVAIDFITAYFVHGNPLVMVIPD